MQEALAGKPIALVSISIDADRDKWANAVRDEHLTGHQLWIGDKSEFSTAYSINAIPRFILLDKNGKIMSPSFNRRPSGPDLLPTLEALLDGSINESTAITYLKTGFPRESLIGKPSPDFRYPDASGKEHALADFRGKYVMVDLWATWCGFCVQEFPHMKTLEEKMRGRAIAFVSISVDADKAAWHKYLEEHDLSGVQLYAGEDKSFSAPFDINGIPRFILIAPDGTVIDPNLALRPSNPNLIPYLETLDGI
jgi:thiol-disulfide isomerase/thioredoxin